MRNINPRLCLCVVFLARALAAEVPEPALIARHNTVIPLIRQVRSLLSKPQATRGRGVRVIVIASAGALRWPCGITGQQFMADLVRAVCGAEDRLPPRIFPDGKAIVPVVGMAQGAIGGVEKREVSGKVKRIRVQ